MRIRPRLLLLLTLSLPLLACRTVEVHQTSSPGVLGTVQVRIHNGADQQAVEGYQVWLLQEGDVLMSAQSQKGSPVWFRALPDGSYEVRFERLSDEEVLCTRRVEVSKGEVTELVISQHEFDNGPPLLTPAWKRGLKKTGKAVGYGLLIAGYVALYTAHIWVRLL